jgi:hypothetical protein
MRNLALVVGAVSVLAAGCAQQPPVIRGSLPVAPPRTATRVQPPDWFHQQLAAARAAKRDYRPKADTVGAQMAFDDVMRTACSRAALAGPGKYPARCDAVLHPNPDADGPTAAGTVAGTADTTAGGTADTSARGTTDTGTPESRGLLIRRSGTADTTAGGSPDTTAAGGTASAPTDKAAGGDVKTSRTFAGPTQYPPLRFAAYGIVAFTSRAVPEDTGRYQMICNAYIASLPSSKEVTVPIERQMVTVWPIDIDSTAVRISAMTHDEDEKVCKEAVSSYGLVTALGAINDAKYSNAQNRKLDGLGPFLLAWSPSGHKGQPDALVLVSDFSNVTNFDQAKQRFRDWSTEIEKNPDLWKKGWNTERLRVVIQLWTDKYGPQILKLFGISGE